MSQARTRRPASPNPPGNTPVRRGSGRRDEKGGRSPDRSQNVKQALFMTRTPQHRLDRGAKRRKEREREEELQRRAQRSQGRRQVASPSPEATRAHRKRTHGSHQAGNNYNSSSRIHKQNGTEANGTASRATLRIVRPRDGNRHTANRSSLGASSSGPGSSPGSSAGRRVLDPLPTSPQQPSAEQMPPCPTGHNDYTITWPKQLGGTNDNRHRPLSYAEAKAFQQDVMKRYLITRVSDPAFLELQRKNVKKTVHTHAEQNLHRPAYVYGHEGKPHTARGARSSPRRGHTQSPRAQTARGVRGNHRIRRGILSDGEEDDDEEEEEGDDGVWLGEDAPAWPSQRLDDLIQIAQDSYMKRLQDTGVLREPIGERVKRVQQRKRALDDASHQRLIDRFHEKEMRPTMRAIHDAEVSRQGFWLATLVHCLYWQRFHVAVQGPIKKRDEEREMEKLRNAIGTIENWWNQLRFAQLMTRDAKMLRIVRSFIAKCIFVVRRTRSRNAANMITQFLTDASRCADVTKSVYRYRYKVVRLQTLARGYIACKQARLEVMQRCYERLERDHRAVLRMRTRAKEKEALEAVLKNDTLSRPAERLEAKRESLTKYLSSTRVKAARGSMHKRHHEASFRVPDRSSLNVGTRSSVLGMRLAAVMQATQKTKRSTLFPLRDDPNDMVSAMYLFYEEILVRARRRHTIQDSERWQMSLKTKGPRADIDDAKALLARSSSQEMALLQTTVSRRKVERHSTFLMLTTSRAMEDLQRAVEMRWGSLEDQEDEG